MLCDLWSYCLLELVLSCEECCSFIVETCYWSLFAVAYCWTMLGDPASFASLTYYYMLLHIKLLLLCCKKLFDLMLHVDCDNTVWYVMLPHRVQVCCPQWFAGKGVDAFCWCWPFILDWLCSVNVAERGCSCCSDLFTYYWCPLLMFLTMLAAVLEPLVPAGLSSFCCLRVLVWSMCCWLIADLMLVIMILCVCTIAIRRQQLKFVAWLLICCLISWCFIILMEYIQNILIHGAITCCFKHSDERLHLMLLGA